MDMNENIKYKHLTSYFEKFTNNVFLVIVKNTFISIMPFTIVNSFIVLFCNFPISGFDQLMTQILGSLWSETFIEIPNAYNNFISIYILISVSYEYGKHKNLPTLFAALMSLLSYLTLIVNADTSKMFESMGTLGIFFSLGVGFFTITVLSFFSKDQFLISFPKDIPKEVSESLNKILPSFLTILIVILIKLFLTSMGVENLAIAINDVLQQPIVNLSTKLLSIITINFGITFLWFFGFNGSYIFNTIMNPIYISLNLENLNAVIKAEIPPHIITGSFQSLFINFGGSGSTLALILVLILLGKNRSEKTIGKISLIPGIFNINEPIVYGLPIFLNFKYLIPFLICPLINTIVTYYSMYFGIVQKTNGIQIPWTTPPIISGFLSAGLSGGVLQAFLILLNMFIYAPFVLRRDKVSKVTKIA